MDRVSTGNKQLDAILHGGFVRGSINLITGAPGSGKTVLTQQLAFANARGDRPVVYLTTVSEPLSKMLVYLQELSFADVDLVGSKIIYDSLSRELSEAPGSLPERLLAIIQEHRPAVVVIDSFKAVADLMPDTGAWRRTVFEVASVLSAYDTTGFWVGEYEETATAAQVELAIADGILELRREQTGQRDDRYVRVLKLRGSGFEDGSHACLITGDGLHVYPRLLAPSTNELYEPGRDRLTSGIAGVDEMIATGWLRGTSTLVAGPSGSGKTMVGLHFLRRGVEVGEPGLLINFQENPSQIRRAMDNLGWSSQELLVPGKLDILYSSPIELQIDTIVEEIFNRLEAHGVQRVVVDALADLERSAPEAGRFRDYVYALTQHFARRNITSMLILETPATDSRPWSQHEVSYMSDNIMLLSMELGDDLVRTARMVKTRGSGHDGRRHVLRIGHGGIEIL